MIKPIIGIIGSLYTESNPSFAGNYFDYNNNNYSKCIAKANGIPIYLPIIENKDVLEEQLSLCNGILLPGGADINPLLYNTSPQLHLGKCNDLIDWYQISITQKALSLNMPILGICRGIQVLNVAAGGTLYQDISHNIPNAILHNQNSHLSNICHPISIKKNSLIRNILGEDKYIVNSAHHQAVKELGNNLIATSTSPDGIIESIEMEGKNFVVGVQWHPEMLSLKDTIMLKLFESFISSCI
ncbi:gamma-glutamyl-gamma-aminobutyrate hydrolase family protein [Clostridium sp. 1001271B_151109_B4]|uniref:gamma-glutamyl-gamma-aminobutyrate hydrolase family protein n=1 Tax=Clostridium sp. 1001271B_151109_B4 TaxID=2787148 RepID=UPI0018AAA168|nr:gamma-glutamyl-gamma-aminobutyrate hydrolase family protein [Clostridium sp. 1001271B_151109_B4]